MGHDNFRKKEHSIQYETVPVNEVINSYGESTISLVELGSLKATNTYLFVLTFEPLVN